MFEKVTVEDDKKLNRYLDLSKFLDFVQNNRLYFRQLDKYDDILEGRLPKKFYDIAKSIEVTSEGMSSNNGIIQQTKLRRKTHYASCWTLGASENMGLWNVYGGKCGLAIQTTKSTLERELSQAPQIHNDKIHCLARSAYNLTASGVLYIDHYTDNNDCLSQLVSEMPSGLALIKNIGYRYEQEVRFVYNFPPAIPERLGDGFAINVNASKIIEQIILSPIADEWFFDLVSGVLSKYSLADRVVWSCLRSPPYNEDEFYEGKRLD